VASTGAQPGNKNATKNRPWADALRKELTQNPDALARIAKKVVALAEEGDQNAIREIGDRLDGRPQQTQDVSIEHSGGIDIRDVAETDRLVRLALGAGSAPALSESLPH
jgi:hypothetical protein